MRANRLFPVAVLALAVACSDTATSPMTSAGEPPQFLTNFGPNAAPSGAHYAQGFGEPTCSTSGIVVTCTGTQIGGVGGTDAEVSLTVSYSGTVTCTNKGGKLVDVKTQTEATTPAPDDATEVRNGQLFVDQISSTAPSEQSFLDAAECPNGNWTKDLVEGSPSVTSFLYTLTFDGFTAAAISVAGS